jgi:hypothetical protein
MEINLNIENKEEARKQLKVIQKEINSLVEVCNLQKTQLQENLTTMTDAEEQIKKLTDTAVGLSDSLKAIHQILGKKSDMFEGDVEMKAIIDSLATFVLGSGAIKLGVISNAKGDEDEK